MTTHQRITYDHAGTRQTMILLNPSTYHGVVSGQAVDALHRHLGWTSIPVHEIKARRVVDPAYFLAASMIVAEDAEAQARKLATQITGWLATPVGQDAPEVAGASTELLEWCRSARDLLALMAGE